MAIVKHGRGEQDVEQEIGCEQFKLLLTATTCFPELLTLPCSILSLSIPHYRVQRTRGIIPDLEGKSPTQYLL